MPHDSRLLCVVCAWRETCQKRFSMTPEMHCADFTRDVTLTPKKEEPEEERAPKERKAC